MIRPDIIVSWPKNNDYPLWRQFIRNNRKLFEKVIISFTQTFLGDDYMAFVQKAMAEDDITFLDTEGIDGQDWRDAAVNQALLVSEAEWVWFTEQDFFIKEGFWEDINRILTKSKKTQVIGTYEGDRLHPCCIFATRYAIERTRKRFGIIPDKLDHFGIFQRDLEVEFLITAINPVTYNHIAGVSHNFRLLFDGVQPVYKPEEFGQYLADCLMVKVPLDGRFKEIASRIQNVPKSTPPPHSSDHSPTKKQPQKLEK